MEESSKLAVVDLGSNSFHMMICRYDGERFSVLDRVREPVRLRMGLSEDGSLSEEAKERALSCLSRFAQRLRGIEHIRVVGTNTLRRAKHQGDFLRQIEAILKTPVDVIGGREEARLIYLGVASNLPPSEKRNFVIDIGGGSTEFIIGKNMTQKTRETRPMGCVSFVMEFFPDNVPTRKRLDAACMRVARELEGYTQLLDNKHWDRCLGASGTIKAVGSVLHAMGEVGPITRGGMARICERLKWGQPLTKNSLPGLREDRVPVFLGGFAVLYGIMETLKIESIRVSPHSMREGLLLDAMGRVNNTDPRQGTVDRLMNFYQVDIAQATRVRDTALALFPQVMGRYFRQRNEMRLLLGWAAQLHEVGMAIAHSGYHKHGAYILQYGDLDGFSQVEQCRLAFMVLNHRKRLKTDPLPFGTTPEWPLVLILRLAFIFHREHVPFTLPDVALNMHKKQVELHIDPDWLENHPMTRLDLEEEQRYWKRVGRNLSINGNSITGT